jgi:hypothetical protein
MPEWIIPEMKPGEPNRRNPAALVGCSIVEDRAANAYVFVAQDGSIASIATRPANRDQPFNFPEFSSALGGPVRENWYITVETLHTGAFGNLAWGYFGHTGYHVRTGQDPADTWVAQAGVGAEEDEGDEAAAAAGGKQ